MRLRGRIGAMERGAGGARPRCRGCGQRALGLAALRYEIATSGRTIEDLIIVAAERRA